MRANTVVIGGGVMGVSIALHLARRRDPLSEPIVLLEKSRLAAGSSGRSGAILRQHYSSSELAGMARDSLKVYASFARTTGRSIGFQRTGVLILARSPEDVALVRANVARMRELGIDTRCVDPAEIKQLAPGIDVSDDTLGAWEPEAGTVDPVATVEGFAELAKSHGVTTRVGLGAKRLRIANGAVTGVETTDGTIEAETVIVASGPWTGAFLRTHGIELPFRVVRPEQHFLKMPPPPPGAVGTPVQDEEVELVDPELAEKLAPLQDEPPPAAHPVILDLERSFYTRCDPAHGRTRVGGMDLSQDDVVEDPDRLDESVSDRFRAWSREVLEARLPIYRASPDLDSLAGIYTMTPDDQAAIGALPEIAGLYVAAGFCGHGFKLAPSIGEGVAQLVAGEPVSAFDPAFFAPTRFAEGKVGRGRGFGL